MTETVGLRGFYDSWEPRMLSILRIVVALVYLEHGTMKLFGVPPGQGAPLNTLMIVAGVIEFVGGVLLLLGLFTRPVAFIVAGEMAVAYFKVHAPMGFWPALNHGEPAVLNCFVFLYLAVVGPGIWSLDRLIFGRRDAVVTRTG